MNSGYSGYLFILGYTPIGVRLKRYGLKDDKKRNLSTLISSMNITYNFNYYSEEYK